MAIESMKSIINEVESVVNQAVDKIYMQGQKVKDAFDWAVEQIKDQHGEGYHTLAILSAMYPKLAPKERKLLAMRIPCGDGID